MTNAIAVIQLAVIKQSNTYIKCNILNVVIKTVPVHFLYIYNDN